MTGQPDPDETRFPSSVFGQGTEPDARFSLANERTFLAWLGTALALVSVGVGLDALATHLPPLLRRAASAMLVVDAVACAAQAWFGWAATERALRLGRPLPGPALAPWLAGTLAVVTLALLVAIVLA